MKCGCLYSARISAYLQINNCISLQFMESDVNPVEVSVSKEIEFQREMQTCKLHTYVNRIRTHDKPVLSCIGKIPYYM